MTLSNIKDPIVVDRNTVTGELCGDPVKVFRRASGWSVHLCIEIGGILVQDCPPDATACAEYAELYSRADTDAARYRDGARRRAASLLEHHISKPEE